MSRKSTTESGLIRAINEEPFDDDRRLVYTDWLEEHGDAERAAFIRMQIRLTDLTIPAEERQRLQPLDYELGQKNKRKWCGQLAGLPLHVEFRRGFVSVILATCHDFLALQRRSGVRNIWPLHGAA